MQTFVRGESFVSFVFVLHCLLSASDTICLYTQRNSTRNRSCHFLYKCSPLPCSYGNCCCGLTEWLMVAIGQPLILCFYGILILSFCCYRTMCCWYRTSHQSTTSTVSICVDELSGYPNMLLWRDLVRTLRIWGYVPDCTNSFT